MSGSITASCGHKLEDMDDGWAVEYPDVDCDAIHGFQNVTVHATFCSVCAEMCVKEWGGKATSFRELERHTRND